MNLRSTQVALPLVLTVAACNDDARYVARFAPTFVSARHTVSVLGVYRDGNMSSESWDAIAPRIAPVLGKSTCEIGDSATLSTTRPALASAIDDYARANGPSDDLLAQVAPAAKGDLVLVITLAGRPPRPTPGTESTTASTAAISGSRGPMGGGAAANGARSSPSHRDRGPSDTSLVEMSASFYSVAEGRSVGQVSMEYSGPTVEDAVARFAAKLAQAFPAAQCVGWDFDAKVDPEGIRRIIDR